MPETPRKRGRPATIDSAAAMQSVVELFRAKGFSAVSLDDLSEATGLSRPSLYRSFGDKLSMYMAAIDAFGEQVEQKAVPCLLKEGDLDSALTGFFEEMLEIYYRDDSIAAGCLIFGTAPASADMLTVKARLSASIKQLDEIMQLRIGRSFPQAPTDQVELAAQMASNTLMAFSARAKSGAAKDVVADIGARSSAAICGMLEAATP